MAKKAAKVQVTPTYMTGKRPMKIGLHDVIKALKVIDNHGHMNKFAKAAKKNNAMVLVDPATVNFVKDFMVKNKMHAHPVGKIIVNPQTAAPKRAAARGQVRAAAAPAKDRFECDFSKH